MYGIISQDGERVLCNTFWQKGPLIPSYVLKTWERSRNIVIKETAFEIDSLMQEYMTTSGYYNLEVFEFTEEQIQDLVIRKLRGY